MKGREIKERLQGKVDPEVLLVLVGLGEQASAQMQEIKLMAELMDKLTNILLELGTTVEIAHNAVDELRKQREN
jgi:hypothetical protein